MKILITGDILRPFPDGSPHQINNINRSVNWLNDVVSAVFNVSPIIVNQPKHFCFNINEWYKTDQPTLNKCKHLSILDDLGIKYNDVFIIGFELPNNAINQFNTHNIKYIDYCIHPIRFLNKTIIGINTNIPNDISNLLCNTGDFFKAANGYGNETIFSRPTSVIIGQTQIDRSLMRDCRVFNLIDFDIEIKQLIQNKNVFYKPHPLDPTFQVEYMKSLGIPMIDYNTYKMLSCPNLNEVIGISSSVLYEAKYFNKNSVFLQERKQTNKYDPMYLEDFLSETFWKTWR